MRVFSSYCNNIEELDTYSGIWSKDDDELKDPFQCCEPGSLINLKSVVMSPSPDEGFVPLMYPRRLDSLVPNIERIAISCLDVVKELGSVPRYAYSLQPDTIAVFSRLTHLRIDDTDLLIDEWPSCWPPVPSWFCPSTASPLRPPLSRSSRTCSYSIHQALRRSASNLTPRTHQFLLEPWATRSSPLRD